jgi:hypothetical protein
VDYVDHEPVAAQLHQLPQVAPLQVAQVYQFLPPAAVALPVNLGNHMADTRFF